VLTLGLPTVWGAVAITYKLTCPLAEQNGLGARVASSAVFFAVGTGLIVHVRRALLRELRQARQVAGAAQSVLLRPLPPRIDGLTVAAAQMSADRGATIGGDLYEAVATEHGVRVVMGDVRGHGLAAIGTAAAVLGSFREAVHDEPELAGVLRRLDRALARHLMERAERDGTVAEEFVTVLLLEIGRALYFGAPYSESLFLLVSVGAFYAGRSGRWAWAGLLAAAAAATRSAGIVLVVPLFILWLDSQPRDLRALAWLALAPVGLVAYAVHLEVAQGDALAFVDAQDAWRRDFAGPFVGAWDGASAAWEGVRQLVSGARDPVYFEQAAGDPFSVAGINLLLFSFLVFAAIAVVGVLRRLPRAYGAYALVALAIPLSYPVAPQPLMSLPRFLAVLFPLFIWLAIVTEERGWTRAVTATSAVGLGLFTAQFASWQWIS
jgi:hypothetical protein